MSDKTSYIQSLMHMIKGNLGTGILAMPASFAHAGLVSSIFGLPILCLIAGYCVHLLIKSSKQLELKTKISDFDYAALARQAFDSGPNWLRPFSTTMCFLIDAILMIAQLGVCSVYQLFIVENIASILMSHDIKNSQTLIDVIPYLVLLVALLLSYIKTLKNLALASAFANLLEALGVSIVLEYLLRDIRSVDLSQLDNFMPLGQVALGFGSAMFAFEGISVVLPVYTRMNNRGEMLGCLGVANVSFGILLILYFAVGLLGYLKFGSHVKDTITLNLPPEPLYEGVRGMFAVCVLFTYPLQFYVPNEIAWNWIKKKLLWVLPRNETQPELAPERESEIDSYEICCRTILVLVTFMISRLVPKLNLLMGLIGSITGTLLSLVFPAIIHLASFWDDTRGSQRTALIFTDFSIIIFGLLAGVSGSVSSFAAIIKSLNNK